MKVIVDIEANRLKNPDKIWVIVCKDIDTGEVHVFHPWNPQSLVLFMEFAPKVSSWIGHNIIGYDVPHLNRLLSMCIDCSYPKVVDTYLLAKLADTLREKHSIESFGEEFGLSKLDNKGLEFFKEYSQELEDYCKRDVDINHKVYLKYKGYMNKYPKVMKLETKFWSILAETGRNGFYFNIPKARQILVYVTEQLDILDKEIFKAFPPRLKLIREVTPKETKYGTLHKGDFRFIKNGDLSDYNGGPFCRCQWSKFNPSSHKQLVDVLTEAGWSPVDKTETHKDTERSLKVAERDESDEGSFDIVSQHDKLNTLEKYGWKINEVNLSTLPPTAPAPARSLSQRILYESRRRTLTEWLGLVDDDSRIRPEFQAIGTWTHRTATRKPNLQNIPNEFELDGSIKLLGKELRSLWSVPKGRLLVGVDAEGIQLRIFAHYIDDKEFTDALVNGRKDTKTDPHSLNQRVLGRVCKSRAAAKRFIYALLLGAGIEKLAAILETDIEQTRKALDNLLKRYTGFAKLKQELIPADANRGFFYGLDGRPVRIPGDTDSLRKHLAMSGYLQTGEAVVMRCATNRWYDVLKERHLDWMLVDLVHDEWQTEILNDVALAHDIAKTQADSLAWTGEYLGLKCPLAGSYYNDDHKDWTFGSNWYATH